jgi:hypothetical protein
VATAAVASERCQICWYDSAALAVLLDGITQACRLNRAAAAAAAVATERNQMCRRCKQTSHKHTLGASAEQKDR